MKKWYIITLAVLTWVQCSEKKMQVEKTQAMQLLERLDTLCQKGYMMGHEDAPFYGIAWEWATIRQSWALTLAALRWATLRTWIVFHLPESMTS